MVSQNNLINPVKVIQGQPKNMNQFMIRLYLYTITLSKVLRIYFSIKIYLIFFRWYYNIGCNNPPDEAIWGCGSITIKVEIINMCVTETYFDWKPILVFISTYGKNMLLDSTKLEKIVKFQVGYTYSPNIKEHKTFW